MTLATELERAWRTLEAGEPSAPALVRSLAEFGVGESRMMLGLDEGQREILFPASDSLALSGIRTTRGVKVSIRAQGAAREPIRHLVIRCTRPDFQSVFCRFAATVLEEITASSDPAYTALLTLDRYQEMFQRAARKDEAAMLGLFGELDTLRHLVRACPQAIESWVGPFARPQDFLRGPVALEVKTTRSLVRSLEIHGLEQLWAEPFEILALAVKHVVVDPEGETIGQVVSELIHAGAPTSMLHDRLLALNVDHEVLSSADAPRFIHRSTRYLRVPRDARVLTPALVNQPLPASVSKLAYHVAIDSCGFVPMDDAEVDALFTRLAS